MKLINCYEKKTQDIRMINIYPENKTDMESLRGLIESLGIDSNASSSSDSEYISGDDPGDTQYEDMGWPYID